MIRAGNIKNENIIKKSYIFVTPSLKVSVTNLRGIFYLSNFYLVELILEPLTLRSAEALQIEDKQKILGWLLTSGAKSTEKHPGQEIFLN